MTRPCCFHTMIQLFTFFSYTSDALALMADFCTMQTNFFFRSTSTKFFYSFFWCGEKTIPRRAYHIRHLKTSAFHCFVKEAAVVHVRAAACAREVRARNSRLDCTQRSRLYFDRLCPRCTADKNRPHTHLPPALSDARNKLSRVHPHHGEKRSRFSTSRLVSNSP